jgi:hypothetical protein
MEILRLSFFPDEKLQSHGACYHGRSASCGSVALAGGMSLKHRFESAVLRWLSEIFAFFALFALETYHRLLGERVEALSPLV